MDHNVKYFKHNDMDQIIFANDAMDSSYIAYYNL